MTGPIYQVEGGRELRRTLRAAGNDLQDLKDVHGKVAGLVTTASKPRAPRVTGRLAASGRPGATKTAAIIRYGNNTSIPYAGPIHFGWKARHIAAHPWATQTARDTEPTWTRMYEDAVDRVLATIKGASP